MRELALEIVRKTFENFVKTGKLYKIPYALPAELTKAKYGVFVAAFERIGQVPRGRVGSIFPSKSTLCEEIQAHTILLAQTYLFRKQDLPLLTYELSVVTTPGLLSHIDELKHDMGLFLRTDSGITAYSLPTFRPALKKPKQRLADVCVKSGIDRKVTNLRLYQFKIEKYDEKK